MTSQAFAVKLIVTMTGINHLNLWRRDLGLLVAFDALMTERSVTRAAERLALGQPAVSHLLARLRVAFADKLFLRSPQGFEPTQRARELHARIQPLLLSFEALFLEKADFNPLAAQRTFRLSMPDILEGFFLPLLLERTLQVAPSVSFATSQFNPFSVMDDLERDRLDLSINYFPEVASWIRSMTLYEERYVCLFNPRRGAPPTTMEAYASRPHISVQLREGYMNRVADAAQRQGVRRNVAFIAHSYWMAAKVAAHTDAVATVPNLGTQPALEAFGLKACHPPFDIPSFPVSMIWHQRWDEDASSQWLRTIITDTSARMKADDP